MTPVHRGPIPPTGTGDMPRCRACAASPESTHWGRRDANNEWTPVVGAAVLMATYKAAFRLVTAPLVLACAVTIELLDWMGRG